MIDREPTADVYRAMVEMAPDHIMLLAPDGAPEFVNRAHSSDKSPASAAVRAILSAVTANREQIAAALAAEAMAELEFDARDENGRVHHFHAHMRRLEQQQGPCRAVLFVRDVSERRRAEHELEETAEELEKSRSQMIQAQKMESVGRLAGGIAHDFNNLLTSIISFSRFVMDDLTPGDPRRADLVEVLKAADSASRLTNQLLAFSRQRKVEPVTIELNGALDGINRVLRRTMEKKVELVVLPSDQSIHVLMDQGQLDQVLMNLAVNARDAMPDGGTLTIELGSRAIRRHPELMPGRYAAITVSDTGTGMSQEVASQVFEPFFSTKGEQGTGLGLSTVYGIVKQAQGHVDVVSVVGQGTVFTILLPLTRRDESRPVSVPPQPAPTRKLSGVALVVEDQPAILNTIVRSMSGAGFNVLNAHSAEEALALIDDLDPKLDILVTDVMLPGLSGLRLTERLRERQPKLPVVLCSGYVGDNSDTDIPRDPYTVFLPKPFTGAQLVLSASGLFE